jgi:hypothetical protein
MVSVLYGYAPAAPTCVKTVNLANPTDISISWLAPANAASQVVGYYVTVKGAGNTYAKVLSCSGTTTSCTVTSAALKAVPFNLNDGD